MSDRPLIRLAPSRDPRSLRSADLSGAHTLFMPGCFDEEGRVRSTVNLLPEKYRP